MVLKLRDSAALAAVSALVACGPGGGFDADLRGLWRGGLDTAGAAAQAAPRPAPDARGVISYPDYQVAVARPGDTVAGVAARLGLPAAELAGYNAIDASAPLEPGALLALPRRVPGGTSGASAAPATAVRSSTGQVSDPFAGQSPGRPAVPAPASAAAPARSPQPRQHVVANGETAWSIARKYGVSVADLAAWNGLPASMTLRTGQRLLVPIAGAAPPAGAQRVSAPGVGSPTPEPPSASRPLPSERTEPAASKPAKPATPDLGATRTAASGSGKFRMPAGGAIIRTYDKGKNDGIDISAAPGTPVRAAGAGRVAAITRDTSGTPIVVIRHEGELMTVYAGLDGLAVAKGDSVTAGQQIGTAGAAGVIHFEVRRGFESVDPETML